MKYAMIISALALVSSCSEVKQSAHGTFHQQATLMFIKPLESSRSLLVMATPGGDTIRFLYTAARSTNRPYFRPGMKYTICTDSSEYRIIDGKKYFKAQLKRIG
jgi:hypothetical protein